ARSDVYSLGALAYFLLAGVPPFAGRSAIQMIAAHMYETPLPLAAHRGDVPADLQAVVMRCLAKQPADRFASVRELEKALAACAVGPWTADDAAAWWRANPPPAPTVEEPVDGRKEPSPVPPTLTANSPG